MTDSVYMPDVRVEVAFDSTFSTAAASRTWTDVSAYAELDAGINITHGRSDEFGTCDPNKLSLTLDNSDGRFTAGAPTLLRTNACPYPVSDTSTTTAGWTASGGTITNGTGFLRITYTSGTLTVQSATTTTMPVAASTQYTFQAQARSSNVALTTKFLLQFYTSSGVATGAAVAGSALTLSGTFAAVPAYTTTSPTDAAFVNIRFFMTGTPVAADTFDVRHIMYERASSASSYFDGSTIAGNLTYAWTGAVNASTSTESTTRPYYPNIKIGRPIRVRARQPVGTAGNMHPNPSVETNITGWTTSTLYGSNTLATSVAQSAVRAFDGTKSVLATWPTTAIGSNVGCDVTGYVAGRTYIASAYVWVPTGSPDVRLTSYFQSVPSAYTSLKDQWVRLSITYAAFRNTDTLVVQCASATSGQTCYVDAVMVDEGTTLNAYTSTPPPISDRFVGYVDEWPVEWPGTDSSALARITASSRMARLGFDAELRSTVSEEYLQDSASTMEVYFPLGEPDGSTIVADVKKNGTGKLAKVQFGTGGAVNFGANTGPRTDSLPAPAFLPVNVTNGVYLSGAVGVGFYGVTLETFVLTSAAVQQTVVRLRAPGTNWVEISTTSLGKISASDFNTFTGAGYFALTSPLSYNDGATHHAAVTMSITAGTATAILYVDGINVASTTYSLAAFVLYTEMNVGGNNAGALFTGTISHVAASSAALSSTRVLAHATAGLTGFANDTATQRIVRLASYALIPAAEVSGDAGTNVVGNIDTTGRTALDSMRVVEQTESGVLYDARDNTLTFKGRAARYNVVSTFTLSAATQQVEAGISPSLDRSALVNDVTGTASDGTTARAVNQTSIDDYGYARSTVEVAGTVDAALQAASWRVNTYGEPMPRIPALGVDLLPLSAALQANVLSASVGTRFTLAGLPSQASATSLDFFIEGYTETIGPESYAFTFNLSPVTGFNVWILEDPVYGAYDTYPLAL